MTQTSKEQQDAINKLGEAFDDIGARQTSEIAKEFGTVCPTRLFSISVGDDGKFYAIRDREPIFCLAGNSITEVSKQAEDAFEFYRKVKSDE